MPPIVMVLVFGTLGLVALWAIRRDLRSGVSRDDLYQFRADTNPFGFAVIITSKIVVVLLCIAAMLEAAMGFPGPMALMKALFGD